MASQDDRDDDVAVIGQHGVAVDLAASFEALVVDNAAICYRKAYFYCRNHHRAEETAQEAFANLWKAWADEEKRTKIQQRKGYVLNAVRNAFLDYRKNPSRTSEHEQGLVGEGNEGYRVADASTAVIEAQDIRSVRDAVLRLEDDNERNLIYLVYYEDYKVRRAGKELGLSPQRAYRVHERAKERLREMLRHLEEEGG